MEPDCSICGERVSKCRGHAPVTRPTYEDLVEALEILTSNIEQAFPTLKHLGPIANARALLTQVSAPERKDGV